MTAALEAIRRHAGPVLIITGVWCAQLLLWAALGALGLGASLNIWPLGEDRNWIDLLSRASIGETTRAFWSIDHRNPLSPWWYLAFKPLILGWPFGLFLLRHGVGLALALSTYALAVLLIGPAARRFAIAVAGLIAIFSANAFFDHIYWNFEAALAASLLCVCCFIRHQRGEGRGGWLAASLVLWLVAIATYTIQSGAILAVGYLALRRAPEGARRDGMSSLPRRAIAAMSATWPFAMILLLFVMIWQTTSVPAESFVSAPRLARLLQSMRMGIWHSDSTLMGAVLALSPHRILYAGLACAIAGAAGAMFWKAGPPPRSAGVADLIVVVLCLAAPTIFVETLGAQWPPGSRWRMIYQVTTPLLYFGVLYLAAGAVDDVWRRRLWAGGAGLLFGLASLASLAHNERQALLTKNERQLRQVILDDAARFPGARLHYLVFLDARYRWFAVDRMATIYARTWFGADGPTFRIVPSPIYEPLQPGPAVGFDDDGAGVSHATVDGRALPYEQIRAVRWRDSHLAIVDQIDRPDIDGYRAQWRRAAPARLGPRL